MRKKHIPKHDFKIDMTPMIDVVFQLMIFFMCTIKFKTLEGKLSAYLPKDVGVNSSDAEPLEKVDILIKMVRDGSKLNPLDDLPWKGQGPFRYGPDRVVRYKVGSKEITDLGELGERLTKLYEATPERAATIDSYPGVVYADLVAVLDQALIAGFRDITFKCAREERKPKRP
jgi:biopolymer transport protein ExbD